ncbi:hypothetical protein M4I21_02525 [Cellulophaga sp. 20_2_10]|uniref:hypothetical protein n=1 Tax=Cellulophaga sp. 20_2_10 TaxID=2942476 RepID=UPI00201A9062|nr:hypothetical protein [Cellulophaga sp. 20_2_10]MCL5244667.1 hypothetical protein [Cellulophaga sp. 20_2_10]
MKKIALLLAFVCVATISAQTPYEKGMTKAFELWKSNESTKAIQMFERISNVEKDNWLPPYYAATVEIISAFEIKDETVLTAKLNKAKSFLDIADTLSKNNPEILMSYALLNTAYIAFDGQKYGMILSGKNVAIYNKALAIVPNNPRVVLGKAEWDMGAAKFFGQPLEPFCKDVKKAIELFKKEEQTIKFYPYSGLGRANEILEKCEKKSSQN